MEERRDVVTNMEPGRDFVTILEEGRGRIINKEEEESGGWWEGDYIKGKGNRKNRKETITIYVPRIL